MVRTGSARLIVVAVVLLIGLIAAGVLLLNDHASRVAMTARLEEINSEIAELEKRSSIFEQELAQHRIAVQKLIVEIEGRIKVKEQHETALAEVLARWRVLSEQRDRLDAARQQVQRQLDELYVLQKQMKE
jgi:chromosome segregation ATPase